MAHIGVVALRHGVGLEVMPVGGPVSAVVAVNVEGLSRQV